MRAEFLTDRGLVRTHNEDSGGIYYNTDGQLLAVIADGMGGHRAGDVASKMAVSLIQENWEEQQSFQTIEETEKWLTDTLAMINEAIYEKSKNNPEYNGMGTTVVVAICTKEYITIAHIGDSRCYIAYQKTFEQITEDHSLVNELIRTGQLSEKDAMYHPRKNVVLKALGTEEVVEADVKSISIMEEYRLLLCSDGLSDKVENHELSEMVEAQKDLKEIAHDLVNLAKERGGEDNISVILISDPLPEKAGDHEC